MRQGWAMKIWISGCGIWNARLQKNKRPLPVEWSRVFWKVWGSPIAPWRSRANPCGYLFGRANARKDSLLTLWNESLKMKGGSLSKIRWHRFLPRLTTFLLQQTFPLNLAPYTTLVFECPDSKILSWNKTHAPWHSQIYEIFVRNFLKKLPAEYTELAKKMTRFVMDQPSDHISSITTRLWKTL